MHYIRIFDIVHKEHITGIDGDIKTPFYLTHAP